MKQIRVASRYSKSLFDLAIETNTLEAIYKDMLMIKSLIAENNDLRLMLKNPIIKSESKTKILSATFANQINDITLKFITILTKKRREDILQTIALDFINLYKQHKNITTVSITSATALDNDTKTKLANLIVPKAQKGGEVEIVEKLNKELVGGVILQVEDKQLDLSVKTQLLNLKKEFGDNLYIKEY